MANDGITARQYSLKKEPWRNIGRETATSIMGFWAVPLIPLLSHLSFIGYALHLEGTQLISQVCVNECVWWCLGHVNTVCPFGQGQKSSSHLSVHLSIHLLMPPGRIANLLDAVDRREPTRPEETWSFLYASARPQRIWTVTGEEPRRILNPGKGIQVQSQEKDKPIKVYWNILFLTHQTGKQWGCVTIRCGKAVGKQEGSRVTGVRVSVSSLMEGHFTVRLKMINAYFLHQ